MSKFRDFDQAVDDLDPITFKVNGRDYSVDPDLPGLPIMRMIAEGEVDLTNPAAVPPSVAFELLKEILGEEQFSQLESDRVGVRKIAAISQWLAEQLGLDQLLGAGEEAAGGDEGNASRSPTSSNGGERSKPTSGASIAPVLSNSDGGAS